MPLESPPHPADLKISIGYKPPDQWWFSIAKRTEIVHVMRGEVAYESSAKKRATRWMEKYITSSQSQRRSMLGWRIIEHKRDRTSRKIKKQRVKRRSRR